MAAESGSADVYTSELNSALDWIRTTWVLASTFLVVSMQLGFTMLEVGSCRTEHRSTVVMKNVLDSSISVIAFWFHTWCTPMTILNDDGGVNQSHLLVFNAFFCATCVTICSGSMAERVHVGAYASYGVLMASVIYPVLAEAAWGSSADSLFHEDFHNKWFGGYSYHDFAGSGLVHLVGGTAACTGNLLVGRRILKPSSEPESRTPREEDLEASSDLSLAAPGPESQGLRPAGGWKRRFFNVREDEAEFQQCSYLQVMGTFSLWFGWYGFNCGSAYSLPSSAPGIVAWNTTLGASAGALGSAFFALAFKRRVEAGFICNGILAGLVAITAACDVARPANAFCIGVVAGGVVYPFGKCLLDLVLLDDPVDAVAVHGFCGLFGVMATAFCSPDCSNIRPAMPWPQLQHFCSAEHSWTKQLATQAWGACVEILFTGSVCSILWVTCAVSESLRAAQAPVLVAAYDLLGSWQHGAGTSSADMLSQCRELAGKSMLCRDVLLVHGWTHHSGFPAAGEGPPDIRLLRADLQRAAERAETGLEIHGAGWLRCLVSLATPFSKFAAMRLRIPPVSEMSGIGTADVASGKLANAILLATGLPTKESRERARRAQESLERQVRELSAVVLKQDAEFSRMSKWRAHQAGLARREVPKLPIHLQHPGPKLEKEDVVKRETYRSGCSTDAASTGSEVSGFSTPALSMMSPGVPMGHVMGQAELNDLAHQLIDAIRQQQQEQQQQQQQQHQQHAIQDREPDQRAWGIFHTASTSGPGSSVEEASLSTANEVA